MDKRMALKILIEHSFLLGEEVKIKLLAKLPDLGDTEVDTLGRFLAEEKAGALRDSSAMQARLADILTKLEQQQSA